MSEVDRRAGLGLHQRLRLRAGLTLALVMGFVAVYLGAAVLVDATTAISLSTPVDSWIPFLPEAIFVYAWVYFGALLPLFTVRSDAVLRRTAAAYALVMAVLFVTFVALPVSGESLRAEAGLLYTDRFPDWGIALLYRLDTPVNLFPSAHVAFATVAALSAWRVWRGYRAAAVIWVISIGLSTCLTKQHYGVDVVAGVVVGLSACRITLRETGPRTGEDTLHYGWRGPSLLMALYLAFLIAAYLVFVATQ